MGVVSALFLIFITILFPPLTVWIVAGCGMDLFINICFTLLGYIPGHIHAFYVLYVYYDRGEQAREGHLDTRPAPGIYSDRIQRGSAHNRQGYGTISPQNYPPSHV